MKEEKKKIPCLAGWVTAGVFLALGLLPTYLFVRLVPVGMAMVIACYCGLSLLKQKNPQAAHVLRSLLTSGIILGALVFIITGGFILQASADEPEEDLPYIVVLGAQVRTTGPSASLQERIDTAYEYLSQHPNTVAIVSGGQGSDEPISEAQSMFECLVANGIAPERILMEDRSASTWGNLTNSLDIIEAKTGSRPSSIGVVSSEYHLFRTGLQAKEHGLQIIGIPAKTGSFDRFLHYFIREICGVWYYLLFGGQTW